MLEFRPGKAILISSKEALVTLSVVPTYKIRSDWKIVIQALSFAPLNLQSVNYAAFQATMESTYLSLGPKL